MGTHGGHLVSIPKNGIFLIFPDGEEEKMYPPMRPIDQK